MTDKVFPMEEGSSAEGKKLALRKLRTCLNFITARYKINHSRVQLSKLWFLQHLGKNNANPFVHPG